MSSRLLGRLLACIAAAIPVVTLGASPLPPPGALQNAVDSSPTIAAARASAEESTYNADLLRAGPHEWALRGTTQRRDVSTEGRYSEWEAGLERAFRWPGKRSIDIETAGVEKSLGPARLAETVRDVRQLLLERWFACVSADHRAELSAAAATDSRRLRDLVATRLTAGDASRAELDTAEADAAAAEAELSATTVTANETAAMVRLLGFTAECRGLSATELPAARSLSVDVADDPALKRARLDATRAGLDAARAAANRLPDPTIGVRIAGERGGLEQVAAVTVSIPLPGAQRAAEASRARARARQADALVLATERLELQRRSELAAALDSARARSEWLVQEAASRTKAADTLVNAYGLGDGDLFAASIARREARRASTAAVEASIEAWRARAVLDLYLDSSLANAAP